MAAAVLLAIAGCGDAGVGAHADPSSAGGNWPAPNGDLSNTRHVGGPIDASSVARLHVAWTMPIGGYATTPIVVDGVVYTQDLRSNVYALDLHDGRVRWRHAYEEPNIGPNGVNVADGRVFGATTTHAFALDAGTGRELWVRKLIRNKLEGIDMAPGYDDGTVYLSTVPAGLVSAYEGGARAVLWAIDAATGRTKWKWAETPADLWGRPDVNSGGGLWHTPAFDRAGNVYISTANPAPIIGTKRFPWASSRPGANRWTDSIVKLDTRTGHPVWARQVLPHDLYDWDLECPVILRQVEGRSVALVAGKMGFVYEFDAATGEQLWKRSVGLHNGHDDDNLRVLRGGAPPRMPDKILPGILGGVETQMAADETTVYVPVNNLPAVVRSQTEISVPNSVDGTGELVALDLATGRVRWDRKLPQAEYGGATVVNDLVFTPTYEGTLWALDTRSGRIVWRSRLPAGTDAPVAVAGDTLLAAGSVPLEGGGMTEIVAYRLRARRP